MELHFRYYTLVFVISVAESAFPSCDEIIPIGTDGKANCHYCYTERMSTQCKDICASRGCTVPGTNSNITGNSNSPVSGINSNSNPPTSGGTSAMCNDVDPCVKITEANRNFKQRCKDKGIDVECSNYCRYDVTKKEIQHAFTNNVCQLYQARDLLYVAANYKDNSRCCSKRKLLDGPLSICEPFCNPASSNWPQKAEAKYLKCFNYFNDILACHWASCRP